MVNNPLKNQMTLIIHHMNNTYFPLSTFPLSPSIPPACFYNIQGLNTYLNQNPSFKKFFVFQIPYLYPSTYINNSTPLSIIKSQSLSTPSHIS